MMRSSPPSSRISASAPALASASIFARRSAPAICAARPETKVWREADDFPRVLGEIGVGDPPCRSARWAGPGRRPRSGAGWSTIPDRCPAPRSGTGPCRSGTDSRASWEGFDIEVLPQPYHMHAIPAPRRRWRPPAEALKASASSRNAFQRGRSASRQATSPALASSTWPVAVRVADPQRVAPPELQRVEMQRDRKLVDQGLVRDGGLRHPEAPECPRRRRVREDGARVRPHVRHPVRTHAVHRNPPRHGGAPTRRTHQCRSRRRTRTRAVAPGGRQPPGRGAATDAAWWWRSWTRYACRCSAPVP